MTFCFGWRTENRAFLVADSAGTGSEPPRAPLSSFGEAHELQDIGYVEEGLLKLFDFGSGVIGAFSGSVAHASELGRHCRHYVAEGVQPDESLLRSYRGLPGRATPGVHSLLAYVDSGGSHLLSCDGESPPSLSSHSVCFGIGSAPPFVGFVTRQFSHYLSSLSARAPKRALVLTTAILQLLGVHRPLMMSGVGGAFAGLMVDSGGVRWQSDATYILYAPRPDGLRLDGFVRIAERGGALLVHSSHLSTKRVYMNIVNTPDLEAWQETHMKEVESFMGGTEAEYWCFLNTMSPVVTVIETPAGVRNDYFELVPQDQGFDLGLNPQLMEMLLKPLEGAEAHEFPLRINFRRAGGHEPHPNAKAP